MFRTFKRVRDQVDSRGRSPRRGGPFVLLHDLVGYFLEVKTFHVKHLNAKVERGETLEEYEMEMLAAGEQLEARVKEWLEGERR